jgi:kynurenine 3-monooxygenase
LSRAGEPDIARMNAQGKSVTLIGAGLTGPLLGLGLVRRGFKVDIYERRPDMRRVRMSAGRSINLALSTRGIYALQQAGLWGGMQKIIIPMRGRMMHSAESALTFQRYGKDDSEVINSISRSDLNIALMNAAESQGVSIHFEHRCAGIELKSATVQVRNEQSGKENTVESDVVIACDGSGSAVRGAMLKRSRFNFSQQHLDYGYKELTIPSSPDGKHALETNALHIWPRGNYMLIALPNVDGTFACILFLPFEGPDSFGQLGTDADVTGFFKQRFPDAAALMPGLADNFFANPTGAMVTIKCSPWHAEGRALLLGDAAHAIVPFFGQGINCGFEDCTVLLELVDRHQGNWDRIFEEFERARKVNTDAIADMAVDNFVEMRDRVADPRFLLRKKVEMALEAKYPGVFVPEYSMVTFHRVPYATAQHRGHLQDRVLAELCEGIDRIEDLDWNRAEQLVARELTPLELAPA